MSVRAARQLSSFPLKRFFRQRRTFGTFQYALPQTVQMQEGRQETPAIPSFDHSDADGIGRRNARLIHTN